MTKPLMQYIPAQKQPGGPRKYTGEVAQNYDAKREQSPKWHAETAIIKSMLSDLPVGSEILDAPVGTGRFIGFYVTKGFNVRGLDISGDMLAIAASKVRDAVTDRFRFAQGSVLETGLGDKQVDASIMCRLTRWLEPEECVLALKELQRVTRQKIIFTARVRNHPHARPYDLIESALDGWAIARDEGADGEDYRVLCCHPTSP